MGNCIAPSSSSDKKGRSIEQPKAQIGGIESKSGNRCQKHTQNSQGQKDTMVVLKNTTTSDQTERSTGTTSTSSWESAEAWMAIPRKIVTNSKYLAKKCTRGRPTVMSGCGDTVSQANGSNSKVESVRESV